MANTGAGKMGAIGPPWTRGEIEAPQGERDMGSWTAAVYTEEQQCRLGVDETGQKVSNAAGAGAEPAGGGPPPGMVGLAGPPWTYGAMEKPAGERDMGGWTAAYYTEEQQARLGVDEHGLSIASGAPATAHG